VTPSSSVKARARCGISRYLEPMYRNRGNWPARPTIPGSPGAAGSPGTAAGPGTTAGPRTAAGPGTTAGPGATAGPGTAGRPGTAGAPASGCLIAGATDAILAPARVIPWAGARSAPRMTVARPP